MIISQSTHGSQSLAGEARTVNGMALALHEVALTYERMDRLHHLIRTMLVAQGIKDLSPLQMLILTILVREPMQPSRISWLLFRRTKSLAHPIGQLLERGYVEKSAREGDGRARLLCVSKNGLRMLQRFGLAKECAEPPDNGRHPQ